MRQKLLNCCRPEQVSTKEYGKMFKRIQILEDGRVPAKEAKDWKIEGKKMRITRKEYKRLMNEFELVVRTQTARQKMLRCGYYAFEDGDWEEYKRIFIVEVAKDEARSLNIVRGTMLKSTDFLRLVPTGKKHCSWWWATCGERYVWRAPNRILAVQLGTNGDEAKVFRAHAVQQGLCENLINALKLLANQQKMVTVRFKILSWA